MLTIDCSRCPRLPGGCPDCVVGVLLGEEPQVNTTGEESCGLVVDPAIAKAIEVLRGAGLIGDLRILDSVTAA